MSTTEYGGFWNINSVGLVSFIGLLFVAVYIRILLSATNQAIKVKQSEEKQSKAKQYIALMNKGQQAYYAEWEEFSGNISDLGLGISLETKSYSYDIRKISSNHYVISTATAKDKQLKSYSGIAYFDDGITKSMICETDEPSLTAPDDFEHFYRCPSGSSEL